MDFVHEFETLRPYNDSEVKPAISRIITHPYLKGMLSYIYPDQDINQVILKLQDLNSVDEFQAFFSHQAVRQNIKKTATGLTFSGLDNLEQTKPYLFIANHHDIVLDSAIMQSILVENNHKTTQITFGSNLMKNDMIVDLGKLNKMFTFYRGVSKIDKYKKAILHSAYIRHVLTELKESIWIAQRDGRTKDGDDRTQSGLIKMLAASRKDFRDALMELSIVPVSISYEYVPCDIQKVREMYLSKKQEYIKTPDEDFNSVVDGILGYKGAVNLSFGKPLNLLLEKLDEHISLTELTDLVVEYLDKEIHTNYTLRACHYIALDLKNNASVYLGIKYTEKEKEHFIAYMDGKISTIEIDDLELRSMFIDMYAKPVLNFMQYE